MKLITILGVLLLSIVVTSNSIAQLPLVYEVENTGISCGLPPLPLPGALVNYPFLPDPFSWSDGSGRISGFEDWACRRNEIKLEIENYEIGRKPNAPRDVKATYSGGVLTVVVTENNETLTLTSNVTIPAGDGPFPVVIGMNSPTGGIPSGIFNGVIKIPFMHNQVVTYSQTSNRVLTDPYYKIYPDLTKVGNYSAWAWGISRLIDGIELVKAQMNADTKHIAVTGCSYAGKMALFSGAFDERVALTIVQESGGGGVNSWRVSETIGNVEKISNTNYSWFMQSLKSNFQGKEGTLPYDHHELIAMIAPRAVLVLGNPPYVWLGDESGYVSCRAAEEVYKAFGIPERFGFSFRSGHDHCSLPVESNAEVQAFVDRFLFNDTTANTNIHVHEFYGVDYNKWIEAWKKPVDPNTPLVTIDSPEDGSVYELPATITITASVNDPNNDVLKVEFFDKDQKLGEDTLAPYSFTLEDVGAGTYYISAQAVDSMDLRGYSNVVNVTVSAPVMSVYYVDSPVFVDGIPDKRWSDPKVARFEAKNVLVGAAYDTSNLSGFAKLLWDDTNIYLYAEVTDDAKRNDSPATYDDDNVEFYFDANNAKATSYQADDVQYSFAWNDGVVIGVLPSGRSRVGINYKLVDTETGYILEAAIPWATLQGTPADGKDIGFEFMINDDDNGGGRDGKLSWNAPTDQAWQDASLFGTIKLVAGEIITARNESLSGNVFKIHPNPAKNVLLIEGAASEVDYQVIDITGQLHLSGRTQNQIRLEQLPQGVYMLKISDGRKNTRLKFVKN